MAFIIRGREKTVFLGDFVWTPFFLPDSSIEDESGNTEESQDKQNIFPAHAYSPS